MFEFSVNKDMNKINKSTYLLACLLALIVNQLKISVEEGRVVTTLNIIKTINIIY